MKHEKGELIKKRLANANTTLSEVEILIENKLWNIAVNRLYYSCFYAITALLYNFDMDTKTHNGVQNLFGLHFIKTGLIDKNFGKFYSALFEMRQDADYEDFVDYGKDDVLPLVPQAAAFIDRIVVVLSEA